jgi:iron(II)-dependent oxidoreductase
MTTPVPISDLVAMLSDARARTRELVDDLDEAQLLGPKLPTVNPLRWEIGHVAHFYEYSILRRMYGRDSVLGDLADQLYDSIAVTHDTRWDLPLLSTERTHQYMGDVLDALVEHLGRAGSGGETASEADSFMYQFGIFHEDMHTEAFLWARQTLAYPAPQLAIASEPRSYGDQVGERLGFVDIPGGSFMLGAPVEAPFLFDNEKWAHRVAVEPFSIARAPVTNGQFAEFVDDGGYQREEFWSQAGNEWRGKKNVGHPCYWSQRDGSWMMRRFDKMLALPMNEPVSHVSWYEAKAFCHWAGVRLPTEFEWEVAALAEPDGNGNLAHTKRRYPWGDTSPSAQHGNLDGRALGCIDVAALPAGDSAFGCRQMLGNIWEWTATTFEPYPGFAADAYTEYSTMLFGNTKVLRGGAWTTRARMMHGSYRNFFGADRSDVFSGFRVCR